MASIFMRFPGGKAHALTLSYDDGVEQDIRLISIMQKNGLKGTFNLNSGCYAKEGTVYPAGTIHRRMTEAQVTALYAGAGMEVAVHGLTHPFLEQLPTAAAAHEILSDRLNLERQFATVVRGMAYPFGTYNDELVKTMQACGIVYSRTVESSRSFALPTDWLRLKPTCHHTDADLMELLDRFLAARADRAPQLFYLWGHSYEFETDDNWQLIEAFAEKAGGHSDVWYATNIEIYNYEQAYKALIFSADASRVINPTTQAIWLNKENETICIRPGEEKTI